MSTITCDTESTHPTHDGTCDECEHVDRRLRRVDLSTNPVEIPARVYEDSDDCLAAAEHDIRIRFRLSSWQVEARWQDEQRETILVSVPD